MDAERAAKLGSGMRGRMAEQHEKFGGSFWDAMADIGAEAAGRDSYFEKEEEEEELDESLASHGSTSPPPTPPASDAEQQSMPTSSGSFIRIENIVITTKVATVLDLTDMVARGKHYGFQYNPKRFAALIRRGTSPKSSLLIFRTGCMVCTGCTHISDARFVVTENIKDIKALHPCYAHLEFQPLTVVNIVGHTKLPYKIDLKELDANHSYVTYAPEDFDGAIIRHPRIVSRAETRSMSILCFRDGDLVITGGTRAEHLQQAYDIVEHELAKYAIETRASHQESQLETRRRTKKRQRATKEREQQPERYIEVDKTVALVTDASGKQVVRAAPSNRAMVSVAKLIARDEDPRRFTLEARNALAMYTMADAERVARQKKKERLDYLDKKTGRPNRIIVLPAEEARYLRTS